MSHTQGTWRYDRETGLVLVGDSIVADMDGDFGMDESVANGYVAAAAPDLLEAAKIGLSYLESDYTGIGGVDLSGGDAGKIRAAIAKAVWGEP